MEDDTEKFSELLTLIRENESFKQQLIGIRRWAETAGLFAAQKTFILNMTESAVRSRT